MLRSFHTADSPPTCLSVLPFSLKRPRSCQWGEDCKQQYWHGLERHVRVYRIRAMRWLD